MGQVLVICENRKIYFYKNLCNDDDKVDISTYLKGIAIQLEYSDNLEVYEIDDYTFISIILMGKQAKNEFLDFFKKYSVFTVSKNIEDTLNILEKTLKKVSLELGEGEVLLKIISGDIEFLKDKYKSNKKNAKVSSENQSNIIHDEIKDVYKFNKNEGYTIINNLIKENVDIEIGKCLLDQKIKISEKSNIKLRYYQKQAFNSIRSKDKGLVIMPIATGKNYLAIKLINDIKKCTLILCDGSEQCLRWQEDIENLLDVKECSISVLDKENIQYTDIIICDYECIRKNEEVFEFLRRFNWGIVFYDNAHKSVTKKCIDVLYIRAQHKFALASTINRSDNKENELLRLFRVALYNIKAQELIQNLYLKKLIYTKKDLRNRKQSKDDYILDVINRNQDKRIIVVAYHVKSIEVISKKLGVIGINKDTEENERRKIVEEFNRKKQRIVCCSNLIEKYRFNDVDIMIDYDYRGSTEIEDHFRVGTLISTTSKLGRMVNSYKYYLISNDKEKKAVDKKEKFLMEYTVCNYSQECDDCD